MPTIRVQIEDFDLGVEVAAIRNGNAKIGAIASFTGLVRDINDGRGVSTLTLEHYPAMTQKALTGIVDQAKMRWDVIDATVIHRVHVEAHRSNRAGSGRQRPSWGCLSSV